METHLYLFQLCTSCFRSSCGIIDGFISKLFWVCFFGVFHIQVYFALCYQLFSSKYSLYVKKILRYLCQHSQFAPKVWKHLGLLPAKTACIFSRQTVFLPSFKDLLSCHSFILIAHPVSQLLPYLQNLPWGRNGNQNLVEYPYLKEKGKAPL